jgi:hypothetical protein
LKIGEYQHAITHLIAITDDFNQKANSILLHAMALNKLGTIIATKERQPKVSRSSTNAFADTKILRKLFASEESSTCLLVITIKLNRTLKISFRNQAALFYHKTPWAIVTDHKVSLTKH